MSFIAREPHFHIGSIVGSGHCVPYVQAVSDVGITSRWLRGERVRGGNTPPFTVIATFNDQGRYANDTTGLSHAAVLLEETPAGLRVLDQWVGRKPPGVSERLITWGGASPVNNGDMYFVVITARAEA